MGHVFISYSKDRPYAVKLSRKLRREGFDPWLDVERLKPGTTWQERLLTEVETCEAYILIVSPRSKKSKWVENELLTAQNLGKPIFPLLLEDTRMFLAIRNIQHEDVRGGKLPSVDFYERLAKDASRRKKVDGTDEPVGLTDEEREEKSDEVAKQASTFITRVAKTAQDTVVVVSKATAKTYRAVADSRVMKNIFSRSRPKKKDTKSKKRGINLKRKPRR